MTDTETDYPTLNADLLRAVMAKVEQEAEKGEDCRWGQDTWSLGVAAARMADDGTLVTAEPDCGTSYCFGGWAVATQPDTQWLTGSYLLPVPDDDPDDVDRTVMVIAPSHPGGVQYVEGTGVWARAQRLLGLTDGERTDLFAGSNTLEDLRRYVDLLLDGTRWEMSGDIDEHDAYYD